MPEPLTLNPYYRGRVPNEAQLSFATSEPELKERIFLGTPGSGKTTGALQEMIQACLENPGALWLASRMTELETASILKTDLLREVPPEVVDHWSGADSKLVLRNGSAIICMGLKAADDAGRYSKWAGLSLSGILLSQVESILLDIVEKLLERLRSPIGPRVMLAEGTLDLPVDHWLRAVMSSAVQVGPYTYKSGPRLIVMAPFAVNARNLPQDRVKAHLARYPEGSPGYGPAVGGFFEAPVRGTPVFDGSFKPEVHVMDAIFDPRFPLLEAWDFGLTRPAILWSQWQPGGIFRVLGEHMGFNVSLADVVLERRSVLARRFRNPRTIWSTGDPAGMQRKDTGKSSVQFLREQGIPISVVHGANQPVRRTYAIQQLASLMSRRTKIGECFGVDRSCEVLIAGLRSGYVKNPARPDLPLHDNYHDHLQVCLQYQILAFGEMVYTPQDAAGVIDFRDIIAHDREPGEPKDHDGVPAGQPREEWEKPWTPRWRSGRGTGY